MCLVFQRACSIFRCARTIGLQKERDAEDQIYWKCFDELDALEEAEALDAQAKFEELKEQFLHMSASGKPVFQTAGGTRFGLSKITLPLVKLAPGTELGQFDEEEEEEAHKSESGSGSEDEALELMMGSMVDVSLPLRSFVPFCVSRLQEFYRSLDCNTAIQRLRFVHPSLF